MQKRVLIVDDDTTSVLQKPHPLPDLARLALGGDGPGRPDAGE